MKRALSLLLAAACLLLCACAPSGPEAPGLVQVTAPAPVETPAQAPAPTPEETAEAGAGQLLPLLQNYLLDVDGMESPVRDYGEMEGLVFYGGQLSASVLYPVGDIAALDEASSAWAKAIVSEFDTDLAEMDAEYGQNLEIPLEGELTVDYNSYVVNGRYVGLKLAGMYTDSVSAHPLDVIKTFNVDKETGKLLTLSDMLLPGGQEALIALLTEKVKPIAAPLLDDPGPVDETWLVNAVLTGEGLELVLERGACLPSALGTQTIAFPFAELEGILRLPGQGETPEASPAAEGAPPAETAQPAATPGSQAAPVVLATLPPATAKGEKPMLALTFDDGPSKHTGRILDLFAQYGGKGTFCVVGNRIDSLQEVVARTAREGHELAIHTWDHKKLTNMTAQEVTDQVMSTRAKIQAVAGADALAIRPPYGSVNDTVKEVAAGLGMFIVNWSVDTEDWKTRNADATYHAIMEQARDGAIILCHDLHGETADAMERVIPALVEAGYDLVTVSELLSCREGGIQPGQLYRHR